MYQPDPQTLLGHLPEPSSLTPARVLDYERSLADLTQVGTRPADSALEEWCGIATMHPDPWVRVRVLKHLTQWAPDDPGVRAAVAWLTHDSEDFIAFEAIRTAGRLRVQEALRDLFAIVGRASERLSHRAGKPVGVGHALVLDAIVRIIGTSDIEALAQVESQLFQGTQANPSSFELPPPLPRALKDGHDHRAMQYIPAGPVTLGIPPAFDRAPRVFDWADVETPRVESTGGFWIDRYPVTASEYDQFSQSEAARTHRHCHPSEPPGKLHVRNTLLDPRFEASHPVAGIDWFDAFAYAASQGKRLPREAEWQRAAQGDDGRAFPWGNTFESNRVRWIGQVLGHRPVDLPEWRRDLIALSEDQAVALTVPADDLDNVSPFGIVGMSGNTWEWTGTNFASFADMNPEVGERDSLDLVYDWRSYAVIRGGTWSSLPELTSVAFRGKDLLTDRHNEIGFRCVCDHGE